MALKKLHILSLGLGQSNFLNQLYGALRKEDDSLSFSIDRVYDISEGKVAAKNSVFEAEYDFSQENFSKAVSLRSYVKICCSRFFWRSLFFEMRQNFSALQLVRHFLTRNIYQSIVDENILPLNHDIYHFHYCIPYNLRYVFHLPSSAKVICSFWGSDLYRNNDKRTTFYVKQALKRANVITIQTPEMGEDLLKRYGEDLRPKLHFALFAQEMGIYDRIDALREDTVALNEFKANLGIPLDHRVVAIGYSATEAFHHIEILKVLKTLPAESLKNLTVVLSLTYQRDEAYLKALDAYSKSVDSFNIVQLHDFLSFDEVAKLRSITDIQIQMPVSDALSGSVTEVLYAGNTVIAANWLPYAIFEQKGITFYTTSKFEDLKHILPEILKDPEAEKQKNKDNSRSIKAHFFPQTTSKAWVKIYRDII
ncbi:glycosyltransferase [Constantimarinum furrinae]|uniref:Glycosyltransferase subfamily 4-like N-terminal domain-containing protein n=1 Tax=Constantimarinum furrinae TaxID=2562285 RepID=A0A7G8PQU2_9FLAO|nr:glycosyltransferase [Constantimarinum furrinae]QNJ96708.1 hypothetical protein ALE3EI_0117 [Constantimarinum furrinae]